MGPMINLSLSQMVQIDVEIRNADRSSLFYLNDDMARKMDHQMTLFFDFIDKAHGQPSQFFDGDFPFPAKKLFYLILDLFDKSILILNQTMFIQFVIFYFCKYDHPNYTQKFLQVLF